LGDRVWLETATPPVFGKEKDGDHRICRRPLFQTDAGFFVVSLCSRKQIVHTNLRPIVPKGLSLWEMGDRVWLETTTPPVLGKEIEADVSLP
jgi:hypothetical protein